MRTTQTFLLATLPFLDSLTQAAVIPITEAVATAKLATPVVAGDVLLCETGFSAITAGQCDSNGLSDVLHFPKAGLTALGVPFAITYVYESDTDSFISDGVADGRPGIAQGFNLKLFMETAFPKALVPYTPVAGEPGFPIAAIPADTYNIQSDCSSGDTCALVPSPEPSSWTLFAGGFAVLGLGHVLRKSMASRTWIEQNQRYES